MIKTFNNRVKRMNVRTRQKRNRIERESALKLMNIDQRDVFDLVVDIAKTDPDCIRYDKRDGETILRQPNLLITIYKDDKDYMVAVDNHKGFHKQWFHEATWALLNDIVDLEAHRIRRRDKHETRTNIRAFIKNIKDERKKDDGE